MAQDSAGSNSGLGSIDRPRKRAAYRRGAPRGSDVEKPCKPVLCGRLVKPGSRK
jgi:hypothetical protein